jgi:hypothetical protein
MSKEVKDAIREHWTSSSSSDDFSGPDTPVRSRPTLCLQLRKPSFQALQRSPLLEQSSSHNIARNSFNGQESMLGTGRPAGRSSNRYIRADGKNTVYGTSPAILKLAATPRPKSRSTHQSLPLRALMADSSRMGSDLQTQTKHNPQYIIGSQTAPSNKYQSIQKDLNAVAKADSTSNIRSEELLSRGQSAEHSTRARASSGLRLRTPKADNVPSLYAPTSKKRRKVSLYDLDVDDGDDIEDPENEPKRPRGLWQTASEAFSKRSDNENHQSSPDEPEPALVPRTPSPTRGNSSIYLPRL